MGEYEEYLEKQSGTWERAAAAWKKWRDVFEGREDIAPLIAAAGIEPGHSVLDVGAGVGDQTLAAAEVAGPQGLVTSTDISPAMLAAAKERADAAGLSAIEFVVGPAEELDFKPGSFDAAVSGLCLMLTPDPTRIVTGVRRLLKPGARFSATVWSGPERNPMFLPVGMVVMGTLGITPPPPDAPGLWALADPGKLRAVFADAGFTDIAIEPLTTTFTWPNAQDYARSMVDLSGVLDEVIMQHAPERREEIIGKIADAVSERAAADGSIQFDAEALMATGVSPG